MTNFEKLVKELEAEIERSYTEGVSLEEAEKLAGKFLTAQMAVSHELKVKDLDSRMRKTGVKAVRAAIYMEGATKSDKKPSDVLLQATVDMHEVVQSEQEAFDKAEVERDELERLYNVFQQAHHYFRALAKGGM